MKKLFTSLLLLGAVTATQAQVTVTSYNEQDSTVTINFKYDGARPTPQKVQEAIKTAFEGPKATIANLPKHERVQKVKTIVLTGDWKNVDIAPDNNEGNNSIAKIITEFSVEEHQNIISPITLDLSQCQSFESKYVSVRDTRKALDENGNSYGDEIDIPADESSMGYVKERLETYFTTLPVPQGLAYTTVARTSTVTVTQKSSEVTKGTSYHFGWAGGEEITFDIDEDGEVVPDSWNMPLPDGATSVKKSGNGYILYIDDNNTRQLVEVDTYTYVDDNGNEQSVPDNEIGNLRTENGKLYYDYTLYQYEDENGSVSTTSTTNPHQLEGDESNGYTYSYNEKVHAFAIYKELKVEGIIFPVSDKFTFIPNNLFYNNENIKTAVLSNKIVAIGNKAFSGATALEEVNFPSSIQEIGYGAFKTTKITEAELAACTNLSRIRFETFQECVRLSLVTFPTKIREIQKEAFMKCPLVDVDLSQCHDLEMIAAMSFDAEDTEYSLKTVTLCSHPKIIRGTNTVYNNGDSNGAFHLCKGIEKVEVVACDNTCVTECVCENRAFEWDITHLQTAAPSDVMEKVALLIFPKDLPVCDQSPYTSSWDFFVGDYKNGVRITQENLLAFYRHVPNSGTSDHYKVTIYDELGNYVREEFQTITCDYQTGNGWHEFIRVGRGEIIPTGEFLRTYSRSINDGPCLLPNGITAYRAVDYKSTKTGWVQDKKNGTHYCVNPTAPVDEREYEQITPDTKPSLYARGNRYSQLTIGGTLYLRPLIAKRAQYNGTEGYTAANKDYFDSEEVYSKLEPVDDNDKLLSYVPENTGVVLYSTYLNEESFLMLPGDFGTDVVYKEFPHTGDRYEAARREGGAGVNTDDDINMLHGSYNTGCKVAPVYPWVYAAETDSTCSGGHYSTSDPKEYRNFACTKTDSTTVGEEVKYVYGWKRLQPSMMKVNRAFAQIPINRFDNHNEGVDQMPDFTIEDMPVETTSNKLMLLNIFEDEYENGAVVDGVKTVNTNEVKTDNNAWYTIQGVRVAQPTKGVYIHNGQKVVIK